MRAPPDITPLVAIESHSMNLWLAVGVGGALGSMARHAVNMLVARRLTEAVGVSTAVVNLIGCIVIGALTGLIVGGHLRLGLAARSFVFVGVLGGFTTFSTFGLDTFTMIQEGRATAALANVLVQVVGGIAGLWLGVRAFH